MRKTVCKWFWAWDFDKEERWLNEMAAKGLSLVAIGFSRYTFEETMPGEYNIRLELLNNMPSHPESENYIRFMEETDAEYLGSVMRWAYFRKKTKCGEFNLFSDNNSRINHLNRILLLLGVVGAAVFLIGLVNVLVYFSLGALSNFGIGLLDVFLGLLAGTGYLRIHRKRNKFKKEQQIFE